MDIKNARLKSKNKRRVNDHCLASIKMVGLVCSEDQKKETKNCGYKKRYFDQKELQIKISLSVQSSVVESFKFNGKNIRAFYIKGVD